MACEKSEFVLSCTNLPVLLVTLPLPALEEGVARILWAQVPREALREAPGAGSNPHADLLLKESSRLKAERGGVNRGAGNELCLSLKFYKCHFFVFPLP